MSDNANFYCLINFEDIPFFVFLLIQDMVYKADSASKDISTNFTGKSADEKVYLPNSLNFTDALEIIKNKCVNYKIEEIEIASFFEGRYVFKNLEIRDKIIALNHDGLGKDLLYKYKSNNNFSDDDLFFSLPESLNDPFEFIGYRAFLENNPFYDSVRILCLTELCNSPFMWTFYADGGRGRCVTYSCDRIYESLNHNLKKSTTNTNTFAFFGMSYTRYQEVSEFYSNFNNKPIKNLLATLLNGFIKPKAFEDEKEFRIVMTNSLFLKSSPTISVIPNKVKLGANSIVKYDKKICKVK